MYNYFLHFQDPRLTPMLINLHHYYFMILFHLYHQGLSVPAFCTFCIHVLGPISHTLQCALFTGILARSFRCVIKV